MCPLAFVCGYQNDNTDTLIDNIYINEDGEYTNFSDILKEMKYKKKDLMF